MIGRIRTAIAGLVGQPGMDPRSANMWRRARDLRGLGGCMAGWLSGGLAARPGYHGRCDVDEDLVPGLTDTLAAACNAGYVIDQSQVGWPHDKRPTAAAAVVGFCDDQTMQDLVQLARSEGLSAIACITPRSRRYPRRDMSVFGVRSVRNLRDAWTGYGVCHPDAVASLVNAWQVELADPRVGSNDRLWPALRQWADGRQSRHVPVGHETPTA